MCYNPQLSRECCRPYTLHKRVCVECGVWGLGKLHTISRPLSGAGKSYGKSGFGFQLGTIPVVKKTVTTPHHQHPTLHPTPFSPHPTPHTLNPTA
ncbi:MAG: hypothetical protein F6J93_02390 [Oscillatoria sp. SIO1A7]|nr:hypothetical protein [Oscillatoria sp. SIO1A7]